ncbi:MAG: M20/M25/M40 family metallo-hydrolase [Myxococcota bacterium]
MPDAPCIRYLRDYVAIPSVNPMKRSDIAPEIMGERRYAEHLRAQLRRLGLDAELVGDPDRPSLIAEASPAGASGTLLVASHLDTVPVDGMEIDPFDPRIDGPRLYGRGSCDTKAGMAALVDALEQVLQTGRLQRNLILVGEADEELGSEGARAVLDALEPRRPDWVLATEPTELRVVTRHKGIVLAGLVAHGVACHSSNPSLGRNAIVALSQAILALEELASELSTRSDPRLGEPTLSIGVIGGGHSPNIVPDRAWLSLDRRLLPGESPETVRAELESSLRKRGIDDVEVDWCSLEKPTLSTADEAPAVRACQRALADEGLPRDPAAVAFGTDAGIFALAGIPSVVMGPGSIDQAHTAREWVETRQVETMARLFRRMLEEPEG